MARKVKDYPGFPIRPFSWEQIGEEFGKLTAGRLDGSLGEEIIAAVKGMESTSITDLMKLLAQAKPVGK